MTDPKDTDTAELVKRLRDVAEFGGTHLEGLWLEAADAIQRLEAERDRGQRTIKTQGKAVYELADLVRKAGELANPC